MWPYLLGHYPFGSSPEERETVDKSNQATYETTMSEWLAVEAIIRQRDKEVTAASIAKLTQSTDQPSDRHGNSDVSTLVITLKLSELDGFFLIDSGV